MCEIDLLDADGSELRVERWSSTQCGLLLSLLLLPNLAHKLGSQSTLAGSLVDLDQPDCFLETHLQLFLNLFHQNSHIPSRSTDKKLPLQPVQLRLLPLLLQRLPLSLPRPYSVNLHSSSRMRVIYHNWSATKQRPHLQSVAEISHHAVLSGDRIRQCETSSGSRHKDTDQCL